MSLLPRSPVVQRVVVVTAGEVSSPTASMLADYTAVYTLGEAPFTKYTTNGTSLVATADETNIDALVATSAADEIAAAIAVYLGSVGSNGVATPNEQTGASYTLTAQDMERPVWRNSAAANVTVLPATTIIPIGATPIPILQIGTGASSVAGDTGVTVISPVDKARQIISRYSGCFVEPVGTNLWRVYGDLAPIVAVPTWTVDPVITGTGVQGSNLTVNTGTYTATASEAIAWLINGVPNGSTGSTFAPGSGDVATPAKKASCAVTITLGGLSSTKITNEILIVASGETKPQNTTRPTITGNNTVGSVVTIGVGTWTNTPVGTPGYTVVLKRNGTTIQTYTLSAATLTQTYTLVTLDEANSLVATVSATNAAGTLTGVDSLPFPVAGVPPVYTNGTASITPASPIVGGVLTMNYGTVTGYTSAAPQWTRNGADISGATTTQYTTQAGTAGNPPIPTDVGKTIAGYVIFSNSWGSTRVDIPGVVVTAAAPPPSSGTTFDNGVPDGGTVVFTGSVAVGERPVGMHWTQFTSSYGGVEKGPVTGSDVLRVNSFRVYGSYKLAWKYVEPSANGVYDWTEWDKAEAFWARSGVNHVEFNLFGVPAGYRSVAEPAATGEWSMQLPNSQTALNNFLTALFGRYTRLKMVEVANEVWTDNQGIAYGTYWAPSVVAPPPTGEASLFTLMNWVLDWRNTFNAANPTRGIKVQAPSTPGTSFHVAFLLQVWDRYQALHGRLAEFDSFSVHCYSTDYTNIHLSGGPGLVEYRAGLNSRGLGSKELRDGEHGFPGGTAVTPARAYNTVVRALLNGCSGIDYFYYGSPGNDETNLGLNFGPYLDTTLRAQGYEAAALLANTTITRVTTGAGTGANAGKWRVEGTTGSTPAPPPPSPSPPPPAPSPSAPALVSSAPNFGTSSTAVANVPSGVANGDKLVLAVTLYDAAKTITNPTGWATPVSSANTGTGGTDVRTQIYERTASSEPASYNITLSGSVPWTTTILRLTGSSTPSSDATAVQATGDEPTNPTTPSITTTGANRLLIAISGQRGGGGISWDAPVGWNLQDNAWQGFPSNLAVAWKEQASAGASGAVTFGSDGSSGDVWTAHLLAYKV